MTVRPIVAKLGGTCVASRAMIERSISVILSEANIRYLVVSAPAPEKPKVTDLLLQCHEQAKAGNSFDAQFSTVAGVFREVAAGSAIPIERELTAFAQGIAEKRSKAWVASRGEWLNARIISSRMGWPFVDAAGLIRINRNGSVNRLITRKQIQVSLRTCERAVIPGFYGTTADGEVRTLPRDGSDITGAFVAAAMNAESYHTYKTVPGFLRTQPDWVADAALIEQMTFWESRELSGAGAKVLHKDVIPPLLRAGIPIRVLSITEPAHAGTLILPNEMLAKNARDITGIAGQPDFSKVTLQKVGMDDEHGFASKVLAIFARNRINVNQLQTSVDSMTVIFRDDKLSAKRVRLTKELRQRCRPDVIDIREREIALIAVVGKRASAHWIVARAATALTKANIPHTVNDGSSRLSFIVGVPNSELQTAVQTLYQELCAV